jgi:hypothetical protein
MLKDCDKLNRLFTQIVDTRFSFIYFDELIVYVDSQLLTLSQINCLVDILEYETTLINASVRDHEMISEVFNKIRTVHSIPVKELNQNRFISSAVKSTFYYVDSSNVSNSRQHVILNFQD